MHQYKCSLSDWVDNELCDGSHGSGVTCFIPDSIHDCRGAAKCSHDAVNLGEADGARTIVGGIEGILHTCTGEQSLPQGWLTDVTVDMPPQSHYWQARIYEQTQCTYPASKALNRSLCSLEKAALGKYAMHLPLQDKLSHLEPQVLSALDQDVPAI